MRAGFAAGIAVLAFGVQLALAQDPAKVEAEKAKVTKHTCGELPVWPGAKAPSSMQRNFETAMKVYGDCMRVYIEDRRAVIKANEAVAKAAIEDYNNALERARADTATKPEVK